MARISVVDDYEAFLETMHSILEDIGDHEVATLDGDQTTIEEIEASRPEVLIVDLRMAGHQMKGWELLRQMRAHPILRDVPTIVCSADIETLQARAAEFERIDGLWRLAKPFSVAEMLGMVGEALQSSGRA